MRHPGIPDYFQHFPDIMLPEADSAQASRRCLSEFSRSRVVQKSSHYIFKIGQHTDFSSPDFNLSSTFHANLAIMSQTSTERNSTMPLPAFFVSRWLLAEQPAISDAVLCFCQPFSVDCTERREVSFRFMLEQTKHHTSLVTPTTHVHRHLGTMFHVTTQH